MHYRMSPVKSARCYAELYRGAEYDISFIARATEVAVSEHTPLEVFASEGALTLMGMAAASC